MSILSLKPKAPCPAWNSGRLKNKDRMCPRKFVDEINRKINLDNVKHGVVDNFGKLTKIVGA